MILAETVNWGAVFNGFLVGLFLGGLYLTASAALRIAYWRGVAWAVEEIESVLPPRGKK